MDNNKMLEIIVKAIDSKKGEDIEVIKIADLTSVADYFVIASGSSSTQVKALADEVEYMLSLEGVEPHHVESEKRNSESWICIDYIGVVVHIFHKEQRQFYKLERLWEDGEKIDITNYLED